MKPKLKSFFLTTTVAAHCAHFTRPRYHLGLVSGMTCELWHAADVALVTLRHVVQQTVKMTRRSNALCHYSVSFLSSQFYANALIAETL